MYALGEGIKLALVYAHMWANIALSNGEEDAKGLKETIIKMGMTPTQI